MYFSRKVWVLIYEGFRMFIFHYLGEWKNGKIGKISSYINGQKICEYNHVDGDTMSKPELTDMVHKNKKGVRIFDENPFSIYWVNAGKKIVVHNFLGCYGYVEPGS